MTKHLLIFMILVFFLEGCQPAIIPTQTAFITFSPVSSTPRPLPTYTETPPLPSSHPPLQTRGPYLLFTRDNKHLTILDKNGKGRKEIQLPDDGYIASLAGSLSPDGKWLAYFTGSVEEPYNLTLHVLNLSDETIQQISKLLAPGFPENLDPILVDMVLGDPPIYDMDCFQDIECRRSMVRRELTDSIHSLDWAPDSQSLAFTAQVESPSSNIYIYTLQDHAVRQLTDELENINYLDWAPNGQSLLYRINANPGLGYESSQWRLVNLDGKPTQISEELTTPYARWEEDEWISDNERLMLQFSDVEPSFSNFRILNTDTGQVTEIWPDHAYSYAVNQEDQTIVLIHKNYPIQPSSIPEGIYIISADGKYKKISDTGYYFFLIPGRKPYRMFVEDYGKQIHAINEDDSIQLLPWNNIPWISPDENLLLFREKQTLTLYTSSYQPIKSWSIGENINDVTWSPDSQFIFIFTENNVYSLDPSTDQPNPLMEKCSPRNCTGTWFVWLP